MRLCLYFMYKLVRSARRTRLLRRIGVEEGAVLKWLWQKRGVAAGTGFSWIRIGPGDRLLTHCRRATKKLVIALSRVVDGSRVSSFSYTTCCTWQKRMCRKLCKKTKMQFLKSRAQEHTLQCQTVSNNMLWGWTFNVFKTSGNFGVFN